MREHREHPLLMKGPLVRATLEGRKTQTRRPLPDVFNSPPDLIYGWLPPGEWKLFGATMERWGAQWRGTYPSQVLCPLGRAGDRLWVRETWTAAMHEPKGPADCLYRADDNRGVEDLAEAKWTPSIHMPRWACRLVLPLVSVRVERVQDITEEDAIAEGVPHNSDRPIDKSWCAACCGHGIVERFALGMVSVDDCSECNSAKKLFRNIWISIYGQELWDANPWVWVAQWERVEVSR